MADADLLSAIQNATQAINTLSRTWSTNEGVVTTAATIVPVVATTKSGRVAYISVLDGGITVGYIHNCQTVALATDANKLRVIPTTPDVYVAAANFNNGLVIVPGIGQLVNVTYSLSTLQVAT